MLFRELVEGVEHLVAKFDRAFNSQGPSRVPMRMQI
jgi:hypothetical protein